MNLNLLAVVLGDAPAANPTGDLLRTVGTMAIMLGALYFVMIRPQSKRSKELSQLLTNLKPGDKVATSSGILGTIVAVKEKSVSLRSAETKLEVLKSSIAEVTERANSDDSAQSKAAAS
jgi:preprotein translocase subunit YajC